MKKRGFSLVELLVMIVLLAAFVLALPVQADEYQRIVFSSGTSGSVSNTAAFYNAKVVSVRGTTITPVATHTNTITLSLLSADGVVTNTPFSVTTTSSASSRWVDCSTNGYYVFPNDVLSRTSTSNSMIEVILDSRSR